MRPKGAKGAVHRPKYQSTHKWPKDRQDHRWAIVEPMASGNHQRPPAQLQSRITLKFRGRLFLPQCTLYSRIQEWCIYGIIYHYAPFLLRNPMVTFPGPNYVIPNQVPNPSPISEKDVLDIQSGNSLALPEDHLRTPTTWPCRS
ncbi:hypothetical protein O181_043694 [Austropuccinia psidii MF-1]|uniref:Uncharacterized protein n=1 Tax=Austropuccinia psidii MF-1 TaxID=1389203 RepID=A0A9Q3HIN8_9BASI|nr:hypothetical protein [Austropuccinia psidii MF-1]